MHTLSRVENCRRGIGLRLDGYVAISKNKGCLAFGSSDCILSVESSARDEAGSLRRVRGRRWHTMSPD